MTGAQGDQEMDSLMKKRQRQCPKIVFVKLMIETIVLWMTLISKLLISWLQNSERGLMKKMMKMSLPN